LKRIVDILSGLVLVLVLLLAACTGDTDTASQDGDSDLLQLVPFVRPSVEMDTRAAVIPAGYQPFSELYPTTSMSPLSFGLFLTEEGFTLPASMGLITYRGQDNMGVDLWRSLVEVKRKHYYIYGFMPAEVATQGATVAPYNGDFKNGAVLTIKGMPTVSSADVCVVTGVQDASSPDAELDLHLGRFAYEGKPRGQNYVGVLLDHLYSEVDFRFMLDKTYYALRHIKLKKLTLKSIGYGTVTARVEIASNQTDTNPIVKITSENSGSTQDVDIFSDDEGVEIGTEATAFSALRGFAAAHATNSLGIVCQYDVYDTNGNLVRPNCVAENNMSLRVARLERGQKQVVTITIRPTYLYALSDPDLDNPTIVVNED